MTIGMFVESLAGKAGALHGLAQDSTPFRFDEENTAADFFGHQKPQPPLHRTDIDLIINGTLSFIHEAPIRLLLYSETGEQLPVRLVWKQSADGTPVPCFTPAV